MARRPKTAEVGSTANLVRPERTFDENKFYEVELSGVAEYPAGSRNFIAPGDKIVLRGRVVNAIRDKVKSASETTGPRRREFVDRPTKFLTRVKTTGSIAQEAGITERLPRPVRRMIRG